MRDIYFKSTKHQRYEDGCEVGDWQICNRAIEIKANINGCKGYDIPVGKGHIVTVYNLDGIHPMWGNNIQMSPKPMIIVDQSDDKIELRGYPVLAMTPLGWMSIDLSNYGITLYFKDGQTIKCALHIFDRNTDIEYV